MVSPLCTRLSKVAKPLNALKRKRAKLVWSEACQVAFNTLKHFLNTPPVMDHPKFHLPFVVYTDASEIGLGPCSLSKLRLALRKWWFMPLKPSVMLTKLHHYSAGVFGHCVGFGKWQYYLESKVFRVVTDHVALRSVLSANKMNSRLICWALHLQKCNFIKYQKGKLNTVPDTLSHVQLFPSCSTFQPSSPTKDTIKRDKPEPLFPLKYEQVWKAQQDDIHIMDIHQSSSEEEGKSFAS